MLPPCSQPILHYPLRTGNSTLDYRQPAVRLNPIPLLDRRSSRYSELIVSVAERVLRSIVKADVCDADGNPALRAAYPEWFADDDGTADNAHQRFSRARADVRGLLRAIVSRNDLYP
jgi:hypothetical protein